MKNFKNSKSLKSIVSLAVVGILFVAYACGNSGDQNTTTSTATTTTANQETTTTIRNSDTEGSSPFPDDPEKLKELTDIGDKILNIFTAKNNDGSPIANILTLRLSGDTISTEYQNTELLNLSYSSLSIYQEEFSSKCILPKIKIVDNSLIKTLETLECAMTYWDYLLTISCIRDENIEFNCEPQSDGSIIVTIVSAIKQ